MAEVPVRLEVLTRITALLQGITPAAGYEFDLSEAVFRGRTEFADDDPLPMISILEDPRPDVGIWADADAARSEQWKILLQGFAKDDKVNPLDPAYHLGAAVEHRLARIVSRDPVSGKPVDKDVHLLGGLITGIQIGPSVCRPPDGKLSSKAFFYLPLRISLATTVGQPYITVV